jgi:hypothetical protein
MKADSKEIQQLKNSISEEELGNIVGMAIMSGTKGDKVGEALLHMGLLTKENKKRLVEKGKEFVKRHEKNLSPEAKEYYASLQEEEEENEEE